MSISAPLATTYWERVEEVLADVVPGAQFVHSATIQAGIRRDAAEAAALLMGSLQPEPRC